MTAKKTMRAAARPTSRDANTTDRCTCHELVERSALGLASIEDLLLDLMRLHCTAIATGDERALAATHELAIGRLGHHDGLRYLACVADMMDAIRRERAGPFAFLPPCCAVVCPDERDLIALLRACRFSNTAIIEARAGQVVQGMDASAVVAAAHALRRAGRAGQTSSRTIAASLEDASSTKPRVLH